MYLALDIYMESTVQCAHVLYRLQFQYVSKKQIETHSLGMRREDLV